MGTNRKRKSRKLLVLASVIGLIFAFAFVPRLAARAFVALVDPAPFWRVRFEVLPETPKGLNYIRLHDDYFPRIWQVMLQHREMDVQALQALADWAPNMQAFVNGHGDQVTVTEDQAREVLDFLDLLLQYGDPELVAVIQEEEAATPLESVIGMTMNEAWAYLNGDPRFPYILAKNTHAPDLPAGDGSFSFVLPENPAYALRYDPAHWQLSQWNNGVGDHWQLRSLEFGQCIITFPRQVSDPFTKKYDSSGTFGEIEYSVQEARMGIRNEELTQYTLYRPLLGEDWLAGADRLGLIVYPDALNPEQCRRQSEQVLATLHRWAIVTVTPTPPPLP